MFTVLSLVTSIKDYVEIVHKFIETDPSFEFKTYYDFGSILTFVILSGKDVISSLLSFQWFQKLWSVPTLIPDIASAMISEISIFDGYFQNTQTFLENPIFYGNNNFFIYCIEKFMIGVLNSIFLCLPTSIAHVITLRRFVMQGLEAGFISGLGTIAGNIVWIGSIIFGLRFVVIPWLSLDLFRYFLGFLLIVKYMWDSYTERRMVLEDLSKYKIFLLTFLLSFTEQTTIYPFMSNLAIGSDSTILESFPTNNLNEFAIVHCCYLIGIFLGSLSFLQFTCWFWENPAFQIYMWLISSLKTTTSIYSKFVNLLFLYLTMICAISNIAYFGLDYTLTNPLGFVHEDRLFDQKTLLETAFLNTKASDRNTRRNRGRHGRRERWKHRVRRYRTFDASLYDQGVYDLLTLEDLNYGFDRFWLRRKIRNHRVRFRFFPGPWMRSFKKQLSRPRLESFMGPRVEFFRILFEQAYHPEFHEFSKVRQNINTQNLGQNILKFQEIETPSISKNENSQKIGKNTKNIFFSNFQNRNSIYWNPIPNKQNKISLEKSTLRKFLRKANNRMKLAKIQNQINNPQNFELDFENSQNLTLPLFSKYWKSFSKIENKKQSESIFQKSQDNFLFQRFYNKIFLKNVQSLQEKNSKVSMFESNDLENFPLTKSKSKSSVFQENNKFDSQFHNSHDKVFQKHFSKKERFLEKYKSFLSEKSNIIENLQFTDQSGKISNVPSRSISLFPSTTYLSENKSKISTDIFEKNKQTNSEKQKMLNSAEPKENLRSLQNTSQYRAITLLHPLKFYVQKEQALKKKFQFYGVKLFRNFGVENNAPYFRVMMKKFFYHYKPTLRWERTLRVATMRRARRKSSRIPRKLNVSKNSQIYASNANIQEFNSENDKTLFNQSSISKPTHFYSLVDKRASRYRYQIYKDVLQHWYYNPFNRFLLKVDVDSFIRRQPNSYFLTKNDEKFLHFKRQLLSEYYETFRWYTYMQHYSTMKNQIGGTKSLTSRAYNQQFVGTLKKIRHLFNITPSLNDNNVLKFDQPLYNEYKNVKNSQIFNTSIIHEELLADDLLFSDQMKNLNATNTIDFSVNNLPEDLTNQSAKILREYLTIATPIRQDYIQKLLHEKNYWELTKFLLKGQKIRGTKPLTNETELVNQEKNYLLKHMDNMDKRLDNDQFNNMSRDDYFESTLKTNKFKQEIWISLFKKCRNKLYDQEALKNYVSLKKEKYENQKNKHKKYLKNRLERMKESFQTNVFESSFIHENKKNEKQQSSTNSVFQFGSIVGTTSSIQKAMKESILWEKNSLSSSSFQTLQKFFAKHYMLQKMNVRQNRPNLYRTFNFQPIDKKTSGLSSPINIQKLRNHTFQQNLKNSTNQKILEIYQAENLFKQNFSERFKAKSNTKQFNFSRNSFLFQSFNKFKQFIWKILRMKNITAFPNNVQKQTQKVPAIFRNFLSKMFVFVENPHRNIEFWKKRENALSKRRKIRKTFKRLRNQNTAIDKIVFENHDFLIPLDNKNTTQSNRQKNDSILFDFEDNKNTQNFFKKQQSSRSQSWKKYYSFDGSNEKESPTINNSDKKNKQSLGQNFGISRFFKNMLVFQKDWFSKRFLRKRSRLRRYNSLKGRGPIKKRTLREKFKRQFKSLKKYGASRETVSSNQIEQEREKKKVELIQFITQRNYEANGQFLKKDQKQRRTRQMKHRVWKKKKQNFAQKRRKLRKRRRSTISKIRVFNKKLQRIQSKKQIQTWWWQTFLPKFQKTAEKTWQIEKNKQIRKQLFDLSEKEILERDQINLNNSIFLPQTQNNFKKNLKKKNFTSFELFNDIQTIDKNFTNSLQIGDTDFQPLAIPEAFRIREKLVQKEILRFQNPVTKSLNTSTSIQTNEKNLPILSENSHQSSNSNENFPLTKSEEKTSVFQKIENSIEPQTQILENGKNNQSFSILENLTKNIMTTDILSKTNSNFQFFVGTNPSPFYAGWDESLRKFVITNRLLSRKKCFSYSSQLSQTFFDKTQNSSKNIFSNSSKQEFLEFSKVPLQGMNAATTLYWQIPFTTYDPDQFFALGMDGFSPLGWRNFSLKHSKQTTKPILVRNFFSFHEPNEFLKNFSKNLQLKILQTTLQTKFFGRNIKDFSKTCTNLQNCLNNNEFEKTNNMLFSQNKLNSKREIDKNFEYRRILKKQKRMKKHPRPPVWFPSGSLSQQVLPVHYIYVFYKRSRFPRDRYIRRRLRSNFPKNENFSGSAQTSLFTKITDFTLRKRAKPRRKYHRKRFVLENNQFVLRRSKFRGFFDEKETSRPSSKIFQTLARSTKQEKRNLQFKQRKKILDSKQSSENLRVRQLRRRVQRQVFRPVSRYHPRAGGFVWPGDYLRLELVKAPQLNETNLSFGSSREDSSTPHELSSSRKIRKKKRRTLQEWQIQPKKYLLEKHNLKVLKKRYEKSGNIVI
uniref:Hypothetical chloroplast RF1 n=1 Tax=Hariotina sp. MMOGRB0030F TaxID=1867922 RepID=A0A2H4FMD0_9CHLO|nr:hypothetical chloroplast RF1 [Hariotina sp. MMOGRB0030F]